ncbi:MAG: lamin tail domain-containing protein [Pseudoclavibacter sp.]
MTHRHTGLLRLCAAGVTALSLGGFIALAPIAAAAPAAGTDTIRITEFAYGGNAAGAHGDGEYAELTNVGSAPVDLSGWTYETGTTATAATGLSLAALGTVAAGESVLVTDLTADEFRTDWGLKSSVKILDNGKSHTLNKGPNGIHVFDAAGTEVDSVTYPSGFFPGKGSAAWVDAAHLGAKGDAAAGGWTIATDSDAEGSWTSATGSIGSPGASTRGTRTPADVRETEPGTDPGTGTGTDPGTGSTALPWPGAQSVTYADRGGVFGENLSGLFYVAGAQSSDDYMWGVSNGASNGGTLNSDQSTLIRIAQNGDGETWGPAPGWEHGMRLHYTDGTGQPDSEGVTAVGGNVFISTERDNANKNVSRVSILQVDPTQVDTATGSVNASQQWDLESDLGPGTDANLTSPADANLGGEAIAFVPDGYLVANGFRTDDGKLYDPASYGAHFGGVFFVGIEKNGNLYGYTLQEHGAGFTRVATFSGGLHTSATTTSIMDAAWDPSQEALWLTCDDGCQGQSSIAKINTTPGDPAQGHFQVQTLYDRPADAPNVNNEGFTFQTPNRCNQTTGTRSVWWSDDSDDDGYALRTGQAPCATPIPGQVGTTFSIGYTIAGTSTPAQVDSTGAFPTPVTATFTCTDVTAVLQQPCPAPVTVNATQAATTVATLTDTLGTVTVTLPAITIGAAEATPTPEPTTPTPTPTLEGKTPTPIRQATLTKGITGQLPKTGAEGLLALSVAAALILAGTAGILAARRARARKQV